MIFLRTFFIVLLPMVFGSSLPLHADMEDIENMDPGTSWSLPEGKFSFRFGGYLTGLTISEKSGSPTESNYRDLVMTKRVPGMALPMALANLGGVPFQDSAESIAVFYEPQYLLLITARGDAFVVSTSFSQLSPVEIARYMQGKPRGLYFEFYPKVTTDGSAALLIMGEEILLPSGDKERLTRAVIRITRSNATTVSHNELTRNLDIEFGKTQPTATDKIGLARWVDLAANPQTPTHKWNGVTTFDEYSPDGRKKSYSSNPAAKMAPVRLPSELGVPTYSLVQVFEDRPNISPDGMPLGTPNLLAEFLDDERPFSTSPIPGSDRLMLGRFRNGRLALVEETPSGYMVPVPSMLSGMHFSPGEDGELMGDFLVFGKDKGAKKAVKIPVVELLASTMGPHLPSHDCQQYLLYERLTALP